MKKLRKFIAYKRVRKSSWSFLEYSESADKCIDAIAPDGGNFEKVYLIEYKKIMKVKKK